MADSPASFQPLKAHTSAGARRPSGRRSQRSGCIRFTVAESPSGAGRPSSDACRPPSHARCAPGDEVDGVFACTRKDRLTRAHRHAVPRARAARPHRRAARRARSATPTCSPAASTAATSCACAGASSASATSCRSRCGRSSAPRRPTPRRSCPSPTATSTSSTASSSTSRARSTTPAYAALLERAARRRRAARRVAPRAVHARAATTPTSAGCSSTPSRSATLALETCQLHPRLNSDLLICAALVHDLGKTREFTYGAEIGLIRGGAAARPRRARPAAARRARRRGLDAERRLALAALRALPPRAPTPRRAGASARPRRSRCTGSTRSTRASRARSSTACPSRALTHSAVRRRGSRAS